MRTLKNITVLTLLLAGSFGITNSQAHATNKVIWLGGAGDWSTAAAWNTGVVPNGAGLAVFVDNGNNTGSLVEVDNNYTVGALTIDAGDAVTVQDNTGFTIDAGGPAANTTLANAGTLTLHSTGEYTSLMIDGTVSLTGGGVVNNAGAARFLGTGTLINVDNTIQGEGSLGFGQLTIVNQAAGVIAATAANNAHLILAPGAGGMTNAGTLQATGGGMLEFNGDGTGVFTNTGLIEALDKSQVPFVSGATLSGGLLSTTGTGTLLVNYGATLSDVTLQGTLNVADNNTLDLGGTITNNGTINLASVGEYTTLNIAGPVTLAGTGTINLVSAARIMGGGTLNIGAGQTIQGEDSGASLGFDQLTINNAGLISATAANNAPLFLDPGAGGLTNTGMLMASGGGQLVLSANGSGQTKNNGLIDVEAGSSVNIDQNGLANLSNGVLSGGTNRVTSGTAGTATLVLNGGNLPAVVTNAATVTLSGPNSSLPVFQYLTDNQGTLSLLALRQFATNGNLSNEGTLVLDAGSTLHVGGSFAGGAKSTLAIVVGGTQSQGTQSPGILQVNGAGTLGGTLTLTLGAGTPIQATDTVTILAASGGLSGAFANVPNGERVRTADGTGTFQINYGTASTFAANSVVLSDFAASGVVTHPSFFTNEAALSSGVYYLSFPNGNYFGYYSYLSDPRYIYHFDLGYEYVFDAADGDDGVYLYDFKSNPFFYTSRTFGFPYLYDFSLNSVQYYYPDPNNAGHYNTKGVRYFYDFATGKIISK